MMPGSPQLGSRRVGAKREEDGFGLGRFLCRRLASRK